MSMTREQRIAALKAAAQERILIIDGAMGTMIQRYKFDEAAFRGTRFAGHGKPVQGNNDLLVLTKPEAIAEIHDGYLAAGADIICSNTFNAQRISLADYGMEGLAYEINLAAAKLARTSADAATKRTPDRPRFVAGALGPTNRTASISPDVNNPGFRNVSFDELAEAYAEQARGLIEGGADAAADRDGVRHAQRQGRGLCRAPGLRRAWRGAAADRLGHHHRPLRAHAVGADGGGLLFLDPASAAVRGGPELRAGRGADAALSGRDRRGGRDARHRLSQRRPAQRHGRVRRGSARHGLPARAVGQGRAVEHRRRLLRLDAGAYRGDRGAGWEIPAAQAG